MTKSIYATKGFKALGTPMVELPDLCFALTLEHNPDLRVRLTERLKGVQVLIANEGEYRFLVNLLTMAGCPIWGWHKGYQRQEDSETGVGRYTWADCGFLKEIHALEGLQIHDTKSLMDVAQIIIEELAVV